MTDIVERLRKMARGTAVVDSLSGDNLLTEAAAEIERLRAAQARQPIETDMADPAVVAIAQHIVRILATPSWIAAADDGSSIGFQWDVGDGPLRAFWIDVEADRVRIYAPLRPLTAE